MAYDAMQQRGPAIAGAVRRFQDLPPRRHPSKVDRASMANSLEVRVPLLDHTLVEWAARLPSHLKLHGREGKYIFKSALEPHVGKKILYRPKQGFAVPLAAWFRGPLRRRLRKMLCAPMLADSE